MTRNIDFKAFWKKYEMLLFIVVIVLFKLCLWDEDIMASVISSTIVIVFFFALYFFNLFSKKAAIVSIIMSLFYFLVIPIIACKIFFTDNKSFSFDEEVIKNEKRLAYKKLNESYNIGEIINDSIYSKRILNSNSQILKVPLEALINQRNVEIDSLSLTFSKSPYSGPHPRHLYSIKITSNKILLANLFLIKDVERGENKSSLDDNLVTILGEARDSILHYQKRRMYIENDGFWTYNSLLPYFITTQNIKPISRGANYLYFIQEKLLWGILLTSVLGMLIKPLEN